MLRWLTSKAQTRTGVARELFASFFMTTTTKRIQHYLDERRKMRGIHPNEIHGLHSGNETREAELTVSDIQKVLLLNEALRRLVAAVSTGAQPDLGGENWYDARNRILSLMVNNQQSQSAVVTSDWPGSFWRPIETAPKDQTPVDLWVPVREERLANYVRVERSPTNVFYDPVYAGTCCVRNASHWMPIPSRPNNN